MIKSAFDDESLKFKKSHLLLLLVSTLAGYLNMHLLSNNPSPLITEININLSYDLIERGSKYSLRWRGSTHAPPSHTLTETCTHATHSHMLRATYTEAPPLHAHPCPLTHTSLPQTHPQHQHTNPPLLDTHTALIHMPLYYTRVFYDALATNTLR